MFIETKTIVVQEGHAQKIVERFSKEGAIEKSPGFIDLSILVKKVSRGDEEVKIFIRWESEEAWKHWEKIDVHIQGHRENRGKPQPEFIISRGHANYRVAATKQAVIV